MRVSVNKDDPGFTLMSGHYEIYLNDRKVRDCFTADEEQGYVDCFYKDSIGKVLINEDKIVPMRMWGKVKVKYIGRK